MTVLVDDADYVFLHGLAARWLESCSMDLKVARIVEVPYDLLEQAEQALADAEAMLERLPAPGIVV